MQVDEAHAASKRGNGVGYPLLAVAAEASCLRRPSSVRMLRLRDWLRLSGSGGGIVGVCDDISEDSLDFVPACARRVMQAAAAITSLTPVPWTRSRSRRKTTVPVPATASLGSSCLPASTELEHLAAIFITPCQACLRCLRWCMRRAARRSSGERVEARDNELHCRTVSRRCPWRSRRRAFRGLARHPGASSPVVSRHGKSSGSHVAMA